MHEGDGPVSSAAPKRVPAREEVAAGAERATKRIGGRHPLAPTDLENTGADGS